jgi:mucin-19
MALILKDRVKETSITAGTGTLTLTGAVIGYQTFNSVIATGSKVYYAIQNTAIGFETEWEVGVGTFTATASLSRDTVLSSSNSGSLVNFSTDPELQVFITQPAEEAVYLNQATGKVEIGGNGTNTVSFTNINTTNLTANTVTITAGTISTNAANATDIVNKQYVDGIVSAGVHYHEPVLVESPIALNALYNQPGGAGNGVGATLTNNGANVALVIDGVTLSNTARVLVYQQANAVQNGFYTVTNPGNASAQWVLTRATDADTYVVASSAGLSEGSTVFVQSGDTGAGEVYTCTTPGTITFGTTDITFAQIGSAQIYSAGTGLSLTNTTFSISNTAVTAAQYGNDGAVGQFTVNAQGQITNAANVSINASSISVGTLANARTTANSANGASTIVARDANGSFTTNIITATDVNATNVSATTGTFTNLSGNGATVTNINASNITSGTINNAFTTGNSANSASTLVLRDANGSFGANVISAAFSGDGSAITGINASSISSGTIANARTTAASANGASTIVLRDSGGSFDANLVNAVSLSGNAATVTGINASNIASGTIANARTTANSSNGAATIVLRGAAGEFAAGVITADSFSGNGSALTSINASNISSGTIDNARTTAASANGASTIVARDAGGNFSANTITATTFSGAMSGNGSALTDINASNVTSGTLSNARTTATSSNTANTIVLRGASGEFSAGAITADSISGNGANLSAINASNIASGTLGTARVSGSYTGITGVGTLTAGTWNANVIANVYTTANSANGANTIVARDANGNFTANIVTATFAGNASTITDINASNITSGTISNARTTADSANGASTIIARDANGSFAANVITGTTGNFTNVSGNGIALTAINASNVTSGTLDNARTTAASANGASTIVQRGSSGEFTAGAITASSFTGSGTGISAINASNISSGTIDNARTTAASANGASTIVLRDSTGNFTANTGSFTSISGNVTSGAWNGSVIGAQYGGTGSANLTADNVILGNGANTVKVVAPGTLGNVLTSDGTTWVSQAGGGGGGAGTITRTDFTASASQTVFTVSYPVGLIDVYRNGVKLATTDFTATNGTSFTLTTAANAGDIVQAEVFNALNLYQTITTDTFSGNGVQTVFTMSVAPADAASTLVAISGVVQAPSNYTVASTTLTFSDAPPSGTNNISVRYLGVQAASAGNASYDTATTSTGYFDLPSGTTAQRPGSPATGMIRYNTTNSEYEVYSRSAWFGLTTQTAGIAVISYLVVAGGGSAGFSRGGGGGAGGLLSGTAALTTGQTYTITVGAGGSNASGSNSVLSGTGITTITSTAGGKGGNYGNPTGTAGSSGGSGGGGGAGEGGTVSGGAGTSGQGNAGGAVGAISDAAGGGGGANAVGQSSSVAFVGGNGGDGIASSITGSSVNYAGGGGGFGGITSGTGGIGGGANGTNSGVGSAGTVNTGGGGGGGGFNSLGGAGGSGVVILSVPTPKYTGTTTGSPTVTTSGSNTILTFTASGSYTA